ncbi:Fic family protein [Mumia sp. ZJ1417]|uniref:Fic family protein n=1 Tax=Mumia sp. ZJ1417 TaxID=2708082 RepID=UPI001423DAE6|nr:Fic family protein [Mumia sp. ZJ1417]QMW64805.1 Fic family protein [Mumia sp. ZJ1417]
MGKDWPAVSYEAHPWTRLPAYGVSRARLRRHSQPYQAAVLSPIATLPVRLDAAVLAEAEEATTAIARFDAGLSHAFGDGDHANTLGEIGPLSALLLRTESASSSRIEHVDADARQLALAEIGAASSPDARLVVRNVEAMRAALALADSLDADALLTLHRTLLGDTDPRGAGRWRSEQVWVGGSSYGPHDAEFVPPHHTRVEASIDDLVRFVRRDDVPVMAQVAIAHAQFETIHPFTDGNGRTGRALIHAMLRSKAVTERVSVPISSGLVGEPRRYFAALGSYRDGDPAPVVAELAAATLRAVDNGRRLVADLVGLRARWAERVVARRHAAVHRMPAVLVRHPALDNALVARELGVSDVAAQGAIDRLVEASVLVQVGSGARNRVWQCPEVIDALDAFATRAARRPTRD